MIVNFFLALFIYGSLQYPSIYFILVQVNYAVVGGIFGTFPAEVFKVFGEVHGP